MNIKAITTAPNLTRLLKELPASILEQLLDAAPFSGAMTSACNDAERTGDNLRGMAREVLSRLPKDDLVLIERESMRITRLDNQRADALHLRLADGVDHDCRKYLEDLPGALSRSADTFCQKLPLFRSIERAMQLRSYRDNDRVYESQNLQSPVQLKLDEIDTSALETKISDKLDLVGGCTVEAVELPQSEGSDREIMLAVVSGGALASQKTFEPEKGVDIILYRPATELILVYRPDYGTIEICGRDWTDRKAITQLFASLVLEEELSERPLTQRNYDLRPFSENLGPEIPASLSDRISELHVTEARYALGDYDRKVTITALAGEPIGKISADVLRGLGTRHGRPFLCDIELFLRVNLQEGQLQALRFRITNQNRSTLQAETDPDKRKVGFDLLEALGVVRSFTVARDEEVSELLPGILALLDHERDTIGWNELREFCPDVSRLTNLGFLKQRAIAAAVLIEDEDLGPVEAQITPDLSEGSAALVMASDDLVRQQGLDPLLSWTINRGYLRETVLERLQQMKLARRPVDLGLGLFSLGNSTVGGECRPVYLWERGGDPLVLEKIDRVLRERPDRSPGLVLATGPRQVAFLGKHLLLAIDDLLDDENGRFDPDRLNSLWMEGRYPAAAADGVELDVRDDCAVLRIPGEDPWTIVGAHRVTLVRKLHEAWRQGEIGRKTGDLVRHTHSTSPQAVFGPDWKPLILDRYIHSPKRGLWAIKIPPA